jgi:hypothetical protein
LPQVGQVLPKVGQVLPQDGLALSQGGRTLPQGGQAGLGLRKTQAHELLQFHYSQR